MLKRRRWRARASLFISLSLSTHSTQPHPLHSTHTHMYIGTSYANQWKRIGLDVSKCSNPQCMEFSKESERVKFTSSFDFVTSKGYRAKCEMSFTCFNDGIDVDSKVNVPRSWPTIPRVGLQCSLDTESSSDESDFQITWFGNGPHETYPDRQDCGVVRISISLSTHFNNQFITQKNHFIRYVCGEPQTLTQCIHHTYFHHQTEIVQTFDGWE